MSIRLVHWVNRRGQTGFGRGHLQGDIQYSQASWLAHAFQCSTGHEKNIEFALDYCVSTMLGLGREVKASDKCKSNQSNPKLLSTELSFFSKAVVRGPRVAGGCPGSIQQILTATAQKDQLVMQTQGRPGRSWNPWFFHFERHELMMHGNVPKTKRQEFMTSAIPGRESMGLAFVQRDWL